MAPLHKPIKDLLAPAGFVVSIELRQNGHRTGDQLGAHGLAVCARGSPGAIGALRLVTTDLLATATARQDRDRHNGDR
jgi:hypothetical protein